MIKTQKYILSILFILFLQMQLCSQVKFSVGPSLGLTLPTGDYSGSTLEYYNGTKYGLNSGINFGGIIKARFSVLTLKAELNYTSLKNSGNSEPGKGFIEVKQNIFIIGAGPEFSFKITGSNFKPYAGIELLLTSFSGETTFLGVSKVPSGTYSMSSATRTGLGLGAGVEFSFGSNYAIDFGLKYNLLNLIGKSFSSGSDRLNSYIALNDEKDPIYPNEPDKHPIGTNRSISVIQLNLAFLFGF